jgi:hypothetical protein
MMLDSYRVARRVTMGIRHQVPEIDGGRRSVRSMSSSQAGTRFSVSRS